MGYKVYYSDPGITTAAGFSRVAHLPCIFDSRPGYHRLSSHYLIDRGLGVWHPKFYDGRSFGPAPTDQTIRNYAHWLANFLEWAEYRNVDLLSCSFSEHVYGRYRAEMLSGTWSRDNVGLSTTTVGLRVQQACDFLTWMSEKGHRVAFDAPTPSLNWRTTRPTPPSHNSAYPKKQNRSLNGRKRQGSNGLKIPTDDQLRKWLDNVYQKFGYAKGLMCEIILLTAVRRMEVSSWRVDTLPNDPSDWHLNRHHAPTATQLVRLTIKFGAKGRDYGRDHGDKIGPARDIWIPITLAWRIHEYRTARRTSALKKWVNSAPSLVLKKERIAEAVHLFRNEDSGERITTKDVYNAWTGVELPIPGWSPHQGRHWWACSVLWLELKKHEQLRDFGVDTASALIESSAMSIIRLQIQPQLGHAHETTTMIYLRWISETLGVSVAIPYETDLDAQPSTKTGIREP